MGRGVVVCASNPTGNEGSASLKAWEVLLLPSERYYTAVSQDTI